MFKIFADIFLRAVSCCVGNIGVFLVIAEAFALTPPAAVGGRTGVVYMHVWRGRYGAGTEEGGREWRRTEGAGGEWGGGGQGGAPHSLAGGRRGAVTLAVEVEVAVVSVSVSVVVSVSVSVVAGAGRPFQAGDIHEQREYECVSE
jgi:hypothetical protein